MNSKDNFLINDATSILECLKEAHQQVIKLENALEEYRWLEEALINRTQLYDKRDRELNCIFSIFEFIKNNKNTPDLIINFVVDNLSSAFQNPEQTCVMIKIKSVEYLSANFFSSSFFYSKEIKDCGVIKIYIKNDNNSFILEEIKLVDIVAYLISSIL